MIKIYNKNLKNNNQKLKLLNKTKNRNLESSGTIYNQND